MKSPRTLLSEPTASLAHSTTEDGFAAVAEPATGRSSSEAITVVIAASIFWTTVLLFVLGVRRRQMRLEERLRALERRPLTAEADQEVR